LKSRRYFKMSKILGWILFAVGAWMMISPQAILGLDQLKWMAHYAFPGEMLVAIAAMMAAYYLIGLKPSESATKHINQGS
ncbi:MAG: hypothetical protein WCC75_09855, partial [Desulfobaccales bacterium]